MKKAIILFNLGGPDKLESVEPFLFNLFNDPAILNLPSFFRYPLAKLISNRRAPVAKKIYQEIGGSSPILKLTQKQAGALEVKLNKNQLDDFQRSSKVLIGDEKENMDLHYFNLAYFTFSIFLMIFLFKKQFNYGGGYLFGIFILTIIMVVFLNIGFGIPCVGLGCL